MTTTLPAVPAIRRQTREIKNYWILTTVKAKLATRRRQKSEGCFLGPPCFSPILSLDRCMPETDDGCAVPISDRGDFPI
jgi:hypothetical protein